MLKYNEAISTCPRAGVWPSGRASIGKALVASCFAVALMGSGGALASCGAEPNSVTKHQTATTFDRARTTSAVVVAQWSPPPGLTGMEILPPPVDPPIAQNGVGGATRLGITRPTDFTLSAPTVVTQFMTYHYGALKNPGMISLRHDDGTVYGPWQAAGAMGQGGVRNAYWWAQPSVELKPGHYLVIDSDPATWSIEDLTQGAGILVLWGHAN